MKKVLCLLLILFASLNSNAQSKTGIKAGPYISEISGENFENTGIRTSIVIGLLKRFKMDNHLAFQLELLYAGMGAKESSDQRTALKNENTIKLDYLKMPFILKIYPGKVFNIQLGPQFSYLLSAKYKTEENNTTVDINIKDDVKHFDAGLMAGFGFDLETGIGLDFRYYHGLSNIIDIADAEEASNTGVSIAFSYSF